MLKGIKETAVRTLTKAKAIKELVDETANEVKTKLPKIYKRELINAIFTEVYTKTAHVQIALDVERHAAAKYLKKLEKIGILTSQKKSRIVLYINTKLYALRVICEVSPYSLYQTIHHKSLIFFISNKCRFFGMTNIPHFQ